MKSVSLSGTLRAYVGKKDAKKNRKEGKVPCVMYGGKEQVHFVIDEKPLKKLIYTPEVYIFNLNINGVEHNTILQDIQYHPVTDNVLHVDFLEVLPEKPITIEVPVKPTGVAPGVLKGGKFTTKLRKLKIKALAQHLPDVITLKIDHLDIGDSVKVKDAKMDNILFLDSPNNIIFTVRTARTVVEEVPGAPGAAPAAGAEKKEEPAKK